MQEDITQTLNILSSGKLILYPTDTVWGIGCDATNIDAVKKIYQLKQRENSKALICLVANDAMLKKHIPEIHNTALDIIKLAVKPTTIIYNNPKGLASNLIAKDNSVAIRIPKNEFCLELIRQFGKPIVSTSANISGEPTPKSFKEISKEILKGVDYVVNLPDEKNEAKPSSIIKISNDGNVKVIRE
ncbi:L-threonylcarbamoyladenylate synthase [Ichthyenterobacterium magnum]|uniref:L-threonylcarbamoyladenylate synthase n=1 Tax=Ichthyenterobacterium magnum TaxID=1230530 RepID=A0A420DH07_9FLAO|nr:L-threonylcarbamoyladenylate synthase [Ichthyenterobacterium magnum]RKE92368.1 L-threonylcarbamoyladenylate synthase [Ichthyenterobacterium magnum]